MIASSTSPRAALEAAKKLVGEWPHAKPADPETYAGSLAAVLAQYPLGLVHECVDPRTGLARVREFPPTVAILVDWLDARLKHHQLMASYRVALPRPELPDDPAMAERVATMLTELAAQLRASNSRSPLDMLLDQRADMRRLRIEEVLRRAEEPPAAQPEAAE